VRLTTCIKKFLKNLCNPKTRCIFAPWKITSKPSSTR
jgi:hypothetical protein